MSCGSLRRVSCSSPPPRRDAPAVAEIECIPGPDLEKRSLPEVPQKISDPSGPTKPQLRALEPEHPAKASVHTGCAGDSLRRFSARPPPCPFLSPKLHVLSAASDRPLARPTRPSILLVVLFQIKTGPAQDDQKPRIALFSAQLLGSACDST